MGVEIGWQADRLGEATMPLSSCPGVGDMTVLAGKNAHVACGIAFQAALCRDLDVFCCCRAQSRMK